MRGRAVSKGKAKEGVIGQGRREMVKQLEGMK